MLSWWTKGESEAQTSAQPPHGSSNSTPEAPRPLTAAAIRSLYPPVHEIPVSRVAIAVGSVFGIATKAIINHTGRIPVTKGTWGFIGYALSGGVIGHLLHIFNETQRIKQLENLADLEARRGVLMAERDKRLAIWEKLNATKK